MKVDIIIPTYHRYELLAETLRSVQSQTYPHWDCWIAEDGDSEKTKKAVKPFLQDKRFHYLPGIHSGTPAAPRNRAIKAGKSPYVAFLDDDDIWLPEKLERQLSFLENHPACVLLGSNAFRLSGHTEEYDIHSLPVYFKKAPFGLVPYRDLVQDDYLINSSVVIQRSVLLFSGLQNETLLPAIGEDYDFWLRIGVLGEIWLMESPLLIYREATTPAAPPQRSIERRRQAYQTRFKIYDSALNGTDDMPSPLSYPEHARYERLCRQERDFYAAGPKLMGRLKHAIYTELEGLLPRRKSGRRWEKDAFSAFNKSKSQWEKPKGPPTGECIIFSKDRAPQLHALVSSYYDNVSAPVPVYVLYQPSTPSHQKAYDDLAAIFSGKEITFIKQRDASSFKQDLLKILLTSTVDAVFFLVDDLLFTEPVDMTDFLKFDTGIFVPSLRMGKNLTYCYMQQSSQPLPPFLNSVVTDNNKIVWQWDQGSYDWTYPLSVDGHLFSRREIAAITTLISFKAPNSFEDQLQKFITLFHARYGVAYTKSKIVNIPCNRVQSEFDNISGDTLHQDTLLDKWHHGYHIDCKRLYGHINTSVHEEITLHLKKFEETGACGLQDERPLAPAKTHSLPDLSVIIVNYNTADYLAACLNSLPLHKETSFEVILVDNASRDQSVSMVQKHFPQIRLIISPKNLGFAKANNLAVQEASGRYLYFLNPDTEVQPGCFQAMLCFMEKNTAVGMAGTRILYPDTTQQESFETKYPGQRHSAKELGKLPGRIAWLLGASLIARREAITLVGGFSEDFFLYGEDIDLGLKIRKAGWELGFIPEAKIVHWQGKSEQNTLPVEVFQKKLMAEALFYQKHYTRHTIQKICRANITQALWRIFTLNLETLLTQRSQPLHKKLERYRLALSFFRRLNAELRQF